MLIENLFQDLIQYKLSAILPVVSVWYHPLSEDVQWTKFQEAHSSRCWLSKSLELLWPFWATAWLDITSPVSSCGCFRLSLPSNNKGHQQKLNAQFRCWRRYIDCSCWFKNTLTYFTWKICSNMTSASRVSRFSTRKSAWWTAWSSAWPLKRWLTQINSRALDPKTQEHLIPKLKSSWSQILQIVGGSYYFIPESAMDSPPYTLLGTQALDGIGMQLLWVSDILLSFICSVIWLII